MILDGIGDDRSGADHAQRKHRPGERRAGCGGSSGIFRRRRPCITSCPAKVPTPEEAKPEVIRANPNANAVAAQRGARSRVHLLEGLDGVPCRAGEQRLFRDHQDGHVHRTRPAHRHHHVATLMAQQEPRFRRRYWRECAPRSAHSAGRSRAA